MTRTFNLIFIFLCCCGLTMQAQIYFTNGNLRAQFTNGGATAPGGAGAFLEYLNDDNALSMAYEVGMVVNGLDPGGNIQSYSTRTNTELGIIGLEATIEAPWRVTGDEIVSHIADFADNGMIDAPIASIYAWPGRSNPFFEEYNGYALPTEGGGFIGDFIDLNGDGIYNPSTGEYPSYFIRGCFDGPPESIVIPSEMLLFPKALAPNESGEPDLQVYLTAFRFGCEESGATINNSIFIGHRIINRRVEPLNEAHFGYFIDGDVGCFDDDYVGLMPDRNAVYFYNGDSNDGTCLTGTGFGDNPPMVAFDLLRTPLDETGQELGLTSLMPINNASVTPNVPVATTDYTSVVELRNYLMSSWRDGMPLLDEGNGYDSGTPTERAFTGNPLSGEGWSEIGVNNPPGDRRALMGMGPMTLFPGAVNEMILSMTYNYEPEAGYLEQFEGLRNRVDTLQSFFDRCFDLVIAPEELGCNQVLTSINGPLSKGHELLQIFPNPARDLVRIVTPPAEQGTLYVYTATGQLLLQKRTLSENTSLECRSWPAGVYTLRWEGEARTQIQKLIISR